MCFGDKGGGVKPSGVTWDLRVTHPSRVEDKLWEVVEEAIAAGWTPRDFIREASEAWQYRLREDARDAAKEFREAEK